MFDLIITGGTVYGNEKFSGQKMDIGLKDGRIAALGKLSGQASLSRFDAHGKIVLPGFVDIHSHSDAIVFSPEKNTLRVVQGITTEVSGNCGISLTPIAPLRRELLIKSAGAAFGRMDLPWNWSSMGEYLDAVRQAGPASHFIGLVGHGALRIAVMGFENRPAEENELREMGKLLEQSLDEGAAGMSSGLIYPPGSFSSREEMIYLCRILAERKRIYTTHMRNESDFVVEALEEALDVARASGAALQVSHHKIAGKKNFGKSRITLAMVRQARDEGIDVMLDMYPYEAGNTVLSALLPPWVHAGGVETMLERLSEPSIRKRIRDDISGPGTGWDNLAQAASWDKIIVAASSVEAFRSKTIEQIGAEMGCDPLDAVMNIIAQTRNMCSMFIFSMHEDDIESILTQDYTMAASDGAVSEEVFHPRVMGTFPRIFDCYVKQKKLLTLEQAVTKTSLLPARRIGLRERGSIEEGMWGDLLVIDWEHFADNTTYKDHHATASGIDAVFLEGRMAAGGGNHLGIFSGRTIREFSR
jgi:N-acyl-D-amino-acid deacylase